MVANFIITSSVEVSACSLTNSANSAELEMKANLNFLNEFIFNAPNEGYLIDLGEFVSAFATNLPEKMVRENPR